MTYFFRNYFYPQGKNSPEGEDKAFHSLYQLVNLGGGGLYRIMFKISIIAAILALALAFVFFILSSYGRVMDENKAKIQRIIWICIGIGAAAGIVGTVFGLFSWNSPTQV
jgi:hypothetical protein